MRLAGAGALVLALALDRTLLLGGLLWWLRRNRPDLFDPQLALEQVEGAIAQAWEGPCCTT